MHDGNPRKMGGRVDVRSRERACEGRGACGIDSIVVRRPGRRPFAEVPGAGNRPLRRAMATATELEELAGNIQRNIQYFDTARQGRAFCGCAAEGAEETSIERRDFRSPQIRRSEFVDRGAGDREPIEPNALQLRLRSIGRLLLVVGGGAWRRHPGARVRRTEERFASTLR